VRKAGARTSGCARSSEGVGRRGPRRACAREGRRESAVGGLDAPARQREGGSESEGVGRRGPRRACAREGRRESAVGGLGAPARGRVGDSEGVGRRGPAGRGPRLASMRLREGGSVATPRACARDGGSRRRRRRLVAHLLGCSRDGGRRDRGSMAGGGGSDSEEAEGRRGED
jgi:hypothetical protein